MDLAILYETETKALNLAVKGNIKRLPAGFFPIKEEIETFKLQFQTLKFYRPLRLHNKTLKTARGLHSKYLPMLLLKRVCHAKRYTQFK